MVTEDGLMDSAIRAVSSQTRVVAIAWLQSVSGVKMPVSQNLLFRLKSRWVRIASSCQIF